MEKIKNIQQALDLAIRNSEGAEQKSGYEVEGREYPNYLSKKEFEEFIEEMKKAPFYNQYKDADGSELEEKWGRWRYLEGCSVGVGDVGEERQCGRCYAI